MENGFIGNKGIGCSRLPQHAVLLASLNASHHVPNIEVAAFVENSSYPVYDRKALLANRKLVLATHG